MPDLVKNGFIYIAQPPLYRVKKGKVELYLKDDKELEDFLINDLIEQSVLTQKSGAAIKGKDLANIFAALINLDKQLNQISNGNESYYFLLEQCTISNFFNVQNFDSQDKAKKTIDYLLKRLNFNDSVWSSDFRGGEIITFLKTDNKVVERFSLSLNEFNNLEFQNLKRFSDLIQEHFLSNSILKVDEEEFEIFTPKDLLKNGFDRSKKGLALQRYKGLGEMNPDQLWETTLDPEFRSILKVDVNDAQRADEIFEELMGDDVEKRKIFIQSNARKVSNLDV